MLLAIAAYSTLVCVVEILYLKLDDDSKLKNISVMHSMLSFVISMLLVFRTNSAYERWWEGRKLWGALVNNSRNLAMKLHALLGSQQAERKFFGVVISNYAYTLKNHLRNHLEVNELDDDVDFKKEEIHPHQHNPNYVAKRLLERATKLQREGKISAEELLFINAELSSFTDICGACERIKNTPIPLSYSIFIKKFIFFYIMTLPLTLVFSLGYYCIPVVVFIFYVLTSLELIAEEIEDPFGKDDNDLPMDAMSKNIRKSVYEILELNQPH